MKLKAGCRKPQGSELHEYRKHFDPLKSYDVGHEAGAGSKKGHIRLLLRAEPQIGKTGDLLKQVHAICIALNCLEIGQQPIRRCADLRMLNARVQMFMGSPQ